MKYIVGLIGFVLVSVVVYFIVAFALVAWSPSFLAENFPMLIQGVNNPIAIIIAFLAGLSSFRASIKRKS